MKKRILVILFIIIILLTIWLSRYFYPRSLNDIILNQSVEDNVEKINASSFISVHLSKTFETDNKTTINNLINFLEDIKVRNVISHPNSYRPLMFETYYIQLINENEIIYINFMDKDYLRINHTTYKIVNSPDLNKIYYIIAEQK